MASSLAVQRRIEAELSAAGLLGPGARPLQFSDLAQLTYLNCVLKEAMRLHPVAANGSVRCVCQAGDGLGPAGSRAAAMTVLPNVAPGWRAAQEGPVWAPPVLANMAVAPLNPWACRKANRDIVLGGHRLSKGTLLWVPLIAPLTSQHNWERAEVSRGR